MNNQFLSSIKPIDSKIITGEVLSPKDSSLIEISQNEGSFNLDIDKVELYVYDLNYNILHHNRDLQSYRVDDQSITIEDNTVGNLKLDPVKDLYSLGYINGKSIALYNFITPELLSSPNNQYYIKEISSDRTELKLSHLSLDFEMLGPTFQSFREKMSDDNFNGFYLNFGPNQPIFAFNADLEIKNKEIFIKLYLPLPQNLETQDQCYITSKPSKTKAYEVDFKPTQDLSKENFKYLKGPNTNLDIKDFVNSSTDFQNKKQLFYTESTSSYNSLQNVLQNPGITLTPDYEEYEEFVNFSSAKQRLKNFILKLSNIQNYKQDLNTLSSLNPTTNTNPTFHSSISSLENKIEEIVKGFDGYEYYLYYNTGSESYPKTGTAFPMEPIPVNHVNSLVWLGSDEENSQYYGGKILKASRFDENNPNWLYYTIPEFIKENQENDNYLDFTNMVGQHFDEIWLYTKAVTEKNNTANKLDEGIPLKLAQDAIESLGYKGFGNNFNNQDNYIGLTGEDDGSYVPSTGNEWITNYIAINNGEIINYWDLGYSYLNYIEQLSNPGWPYAIDDVSKEIFKRLFHNMSYLVKKKGTISGLRQLINIWGIPESILRISEFGGMGRDPDEGLDLWYNRYSYSYNPVANQHKNHSYVNIPWKPLNRNFIEESEIIVPDALSFRFKSSGFPSSSVEGENFTQNLVYKKSADVTRKLPDFSINLYYTGSISSSYSGSSESGYEEYGVVNFMIKTPSSPESYVKSQDIYLPFFNKEWWSVLLTRDTHTNNPNEEIKYTLIVKSKPSRGENSNQIKYQGSASLNSNGDQNVNLNFNLQSDQITEGGLFIGKTLTHNSIGTDFPLTHTGFSGSYQELRLYSNPISEELFDNYVMNPRSIMGYNLTGSQSSYDLVSFRAPLGNELESMFTTSLSSSYIENYTSIHPSIGDVGSFYDNLGSPLTSSEYYINYETNTTLRTFSKPNWETYFLEQPVMGVKDRISNKIKIVDNKNFGETLSINKTIEQNYASDQNHTENLNQLEVAFSPQNEINDEIINTYGYSTISEILGDPRDNHPDKQYYPKLKELALDYFKKYSEGNIYDYLRLVKYFDSSIFRAIKNYAPARTSVTTGIVIKSHLLERQKYPLPLINNQTQISSTIVGGINTPVHLENLEIKASFGIGGITGSTGGALNPYNYSGPPNFNQIPNTQSWKRDIITPLGKMAKTEDTQKEFYNGVYSGSNVIVTEQSLFDNYLSTPNIIESTYNIKVDHGEILKYVQPLNSAFIEVIIITDANRDFPSNMKSQPLPIDVVARIYLYSPPNLSPEVYVAGITINPTVTGNPSWEEILTETTGWYPENGYFYGPNQPLQPGSSPNYENHKRPPFFQIQLPQPLNNVKYDDINNPDTNSGGLSWGVITSAGLIYKETGLTIALTETSSPQTHNQSRWFLFDTKSNNRYNPRPIKLSNPGNQTFNFPSNPISISQDDFIFLCPKRQEIPLYQGYSEYPNPTISQGEAKIYLEPVCNYYLGSFEQYVPRALGIHNIDIQGNNNNPTLVLPPDYDLNLSSSITSYQREDGRWSSNLYSPSLTLSLRNYNVNSEVHSFFYNKGSGPRNTQITPPPQEQTFNFSPHLPQNETDFYNSIYNALNNNVDKGRVNSNIMEVDYSFGTLPVNINEIEMGTAVKAELPDLYYTSNKIIQSRYLGSKLKSAQYNRYTPKGRIAPNYFNLFSFNEPLPIVLPHFINGDTDLIQGPTGSWEGDSSYGKSSVIDIHPKYIAHFKSSFEDYNNWGTYKFNIDQLIEIPNEKLKGIKLTRTNTIKIDGSNDNLAKVTSNFPIEFKTVVNFNIPPNPLVESNNNPPLNVISTQEENYQFIFSSGVDYIPISSNQTSKTTTSNDYHYIKNEFPIITGSDGKGQILMVTGSNKLILSGSQTLDFIDFKREGDPQGFSTSSTSSIGFMSLKGPHLAVINTFNQCLYNKIELDVSSIIITPGQGEAGVTPGMDFTDSSNYIKWVPTSSLEGWGEHNTPMIIKRGDGIRINYKTQGLVSQIPGESTFEEVITQDFTILNVPGSPRNTSDTHNKYTYRVDNSTNGEGTTNIENIFDVLEVFPDPSTLENKIPNGEILSYAIRRRVEKDNKVTTLMDSFVNSKGAKSPTGEGFLLPENLSIQQKENALNLINNLKAQNSFKS